MTILAAQIVDNRASDSARSLGRLVMDWYPLWNSLRIAAIACVLVFFSGIALAIT